MAAGVSATRSAPTVCPGHSRPVTEIHFSQETPDGVFFVSACLDKLPMLRDGASGDWIGTFQGHKGAVWSARLNPEATRVATGSGDFSASLWDPLTGDLLRTFEHKHIVKSVDFTPDSRFLATGGAESRVRVFDLEAGPADPPVLNLLLPAKVRKVLFLPCNPDLLLAACEDGSLRAIRWRDAVAEEAARFDGPVRDLEFCHVRAGGADTRILSVAAGSKAYFFDVSPAGALTSKASFTVEKRNPDGTVEGLLTSVDTVSLNPKDASQFVASGGEDQLWLFVCNMSDGSVAHILRGHHGPPRCVRFHPNGDILASGSEDGTIRLWSYASLDSDPEAAGR